MAQKDLEILDKLNQILNNHPDKIEGMVFTYAKCLNNTVLVQSEEFYENGKPSTLTNKVSEIYKDVIQSLGYNQA